MVERPKEPITLKENGDIPTPPKFQGKQRVQRLRNKTAVIRENSIQSYYDVDNDHLEIDEIEIYEYGNKEETRTIYKLENIPEKMKENVKEKVVEK